MTKIKTTNPTPKQRRGVRLRKPSDIRRLLNKCINQTLTEEMETDRLRAISYCCQVILKIYEIDEIESRLTLLEGKVR